MTSSNHQGRSDTAGQSPTGQSDTRTFPPKYLTSDEGETILLASNQEDAQREAQDMTPLDPVRVEPDGWAMDVGWDRENYARKRDFIAESGYTSWWDCLGGDHDSRVETKKLRRAWKVIFLDVEEAS